MPLALLLAAVASLISTLDIRISILLEGLEVVN